LKGGRFDVRRVIRLPFVGGELVGAEVIGAAGKANGKRRALAFFAVDGKSAPMQTHQILRKGKANARTVPVAGSLFRSLLEALENDLLLFLRDPRSGILHYNLACFLRVMDGDRYSPLLWSHLDRVGEEIPNDVLQGLPIRVHRASLFSIGRVALFSDERQPVSLGQRFHGADKLVDERL
jgi:hypothetical protein